MSLSRSVILRLPSLVERADVAGVQPAVGVDRLRGGLGVVEVAEHHVVAAHQELAAVVGDLWLHAGDRPAVGGRHRGRVVVVAAHRHDDRASVMPKAVTTWSMASSVSHPLDEHDRDDGGAGDREPQRREVALRAAGAVEQRLVERRCAREDGDPLGLARAASSRRDRTSPPGRASPGQQADHDADLVAEGVEERVDHQVAVVAGGPRRARPTPRDADGLAVRAHRALAATGGAGGEEDVGHVVG